MLILLGQLACIVMLVFLLFAAIVVPHNEKHVQKVIIVGLALLVGWHVTAHETLCAACLNIAGATVLLLYREAIWRWLYAWCAPSPQRPVRRASWPEYQMQYPHEE